MTSPHHIITTLLQQAADLWRDRLNYPQVLELTTEATRLIRSIDPPTLETNLWLAEALVIHAEASIAGGFFEETIRATQQAIALYEAADRPAQTIRPLIVYGRLLLQTGDYSNALEPLYKAAALAEQHTAETELARAYSIIGSVLTGFGDHANAYDYYLRSMALSEMNTDLGALAAGYNNLAHVLHRLNRLDEALNYANRAVHLFETLHRIPGLSVAHGTLGDILVEMGQSALAEAHFQQAVDYGRQYGRKGYELGPMASLATIYAQQGRTAEALHTAQAVMVFGTEAGEKRHVARGHELLAGIYEQMGDLAQALHHQKAYHAIQTSIINEQTATRVQQMLILHRTEQVESEADQQRRLREQDRLYYDKLAKLRKSLMDAAAHDMKGPLSTIHVTTQLLLENLSTADERTLKWLNRIEASTQQSLELILRLLDLVTGHELGEMHDIELAPILLTALNDFQVQADYKGIRLELVRPVPAVSLCADAMQLQQVVNNLLSNAIKYTDSGGAVTVKVDTTESEVVVRVQDTGIGIPAADIAPIFDVSFRAGNVMQREGTGLGLAIVKAIIEQHGGGVWVESVEGQGSTFGFTLPIAPPR